ncbi:hypothetical protein QR680_005671 [Steinernema hermaphroditum]|uniref:Uncharacterized protein n=1 Tax=Steinernema hermaphroditum TaxID=289476 RepID=A0AA39LW43_9BILA|nr:hypothetical protein QR680_005671 [Steinernema hermaphroditum]
MDVRVALLALLLLHCRLLRADDFDEEEENAQKPPEDHEAAEVASLYDLYHSVAGLPEGDRKLTPTDQMMKAVYLEARTNFPLALHFDLVMALKKKGVDVGEHLHEPSDAGNMVLSQAQLIRIRALLGVVLEMLHSERFPISLVFDFYRDKVGRTHCFFIFQYAYGSRRTAIFWKNHVFSKKPSGHNVHKAFVDGLLADEAFFQKHMKLSVDLPALFAKNIVAVSVGGASSLTKTEKEKLMDGADGLIFFLDMFRQRNETSKTTIVNLRCSEGVTAEPEEGHWDFEEFEEEEDEKEWKEPQVLCGILKSHRNALDAFANWKMRSLKTITDENLQRVVNASNLFGFSAKAAVSAADSYRDFMAALHSTTFTKELVTASPSLEMWAEILENLTPLGINDDLLLLAQHFIAVPFNATYLTHSLLKKMECEQIFPLSVEIIEALLTVQINGPSLRVFDPRLCTDLWIENGNVATDDKSSEPSEKMQMALGRIPRGDIDVNDFTDYSSLYVEKTDLDEEWEEIVAEKRADFDVQRFLDKYAYFFA